MEHHNLIDAPLAGSEPRAYGDALLERGAKLARDGEEIVVTGNALARDVAEDPQRFSSGVSRFLQLPNGLDGEEHTKVRSLIDAYLAPTRSTTSSRSFAPSPASWPPTPPLAARSTRSTTWARSTRCGR